VAFLGTDAAKHAVSSRRHCRRETIYLNDVPYQVIGVMAKKKQDSSYDGWDVNKIFVPFSAMRRDFPQAASHPLYVDQLLVTPKSVGSTRLAKYEVRHVLGRQHNFDPATKRLVRSGTLCRKRKPSSHDQRHEIFPGRRWGCDACARRLGVMNVMLVAVRERRGEIGRA